jgi:type IV pilus assembly protein PilW
VKTPTPLRGNMKRRSQQGLTLVELMVAMTIGIFLVGAVGIIYVNTSTTSRSSTLESQMNEDAALALELLQQQIRLAGYSSVDTDGIRQFSGIAVRGCDGGFAVGGTAADNDGTTAFSSLECKTGATDDDNDALAVRYEATLLNSQEVTDAGGVKRPGNCIHEGISAWDASGAGGSSANNVALADNRYYIADDGDVPSLFCKGRKDANFSNATALIPNIEDMQITYGVTAAPEENKPFPNQITAYVKASDTVLGATAENWSRVVAIRICLLARSANPVPAGNNAVGRAASGSGATAVAEVQGLGTYVDCEGTKQTKSDRYLRRAYATTIQLRNMRPALPAPYEAPAGEVSDPWRTLPAS